MSPHSGFMCAFQFLWNQLGKVSAQLWGYEQYCTERGNAVMTTGLLIIGAILIPVIDWLRG